MQIALCNQFSDQAAYPFFVGRQQVGWTLRSHRPILQHFPDFFLLTDDRIILHPNLSNYELRSQALATVVSYLKQHGHLSQWRGELYDITFEYGRPALFALERGAVVFFGFAAFGTHLNGYTYHHEKLYIWIAKRSKNLVVAPGLLDNITAGGLPKGITPKENIIKEAWEEARLPEALTKKARAKGFISYVSTSPHGIAPEFIFIYDLELSPTVIPIINDGEVESFSCMPASEVYELVKNTRHFKANSALIMIDFLIRKNIITPSEPDYQQLKTYLKCPFNFQTNPSL